MDEARIIVRRYAMVGMLAQEFRPKVAIEIGVHRGNTSRRVAPHCEKFYGFDLWEDGTDENDRLEDNGKGRSSMADAEFALRKYEFELIKGNTRLTLPEFSRRGIGVDFAFIDGGHSIETIRSDWENVRKMMNPGGVVVFDDYYVPRHPDWGCNGIVEPLSPELLPPDPHPYGQVHLAVITT